jgi:hypothetical protein
MARHNISSADKLFYGQSQIAGKHNSNRGIPLHPVIFVDLGSPAALDADALVVATTSTDLPNATTITYTFPGSASPIDGARADGILGR